MLCYFGNTLKINAKLLATWAEYIMNETATIEIAPTYLEFAAHHAAKKICIQPLASTSNFNNSLPSQLPIPNIKEFLEKMDKDEESSGNYIQFIDAFNKQKISVKHIKDLNEEEFQNKEEEILHEFQMIEDIQSNFHYDEFLHYQEL
ncbi:hypothetical protein C1645_827701 [Glomus cerebriforme]|uniref:Uncharacterized protein n=1 Tax=Glomus cerebriforme TaxID=658196 RepID=A0A397SS99_9GLOM|nr:hypothetical protein C1645_827701 [Glomus cerebriforme]